MASTESIESFRQSIDAVMSILKTLKEEWLRIEQNFSQILNQTELDESAWKYLEREFGYEPLCFKTADLLREVGRILLRCPIDYIMRLKAIQGEMEKIPLIQKGVWKTDTFNVSDDLITLGIRLQEIHDMITDSGGSKEGAPAIVASGCLPPPARRRGRRASNAIRVRNMVISQKSKNLDGITMEKVREIAREIDNVFKKRRIDPKEDKTLVKSCKKEGVKTFSYLALANSGEPAIKNLRSFFSKRQSEAHLESQS